MDLRIFCVTYMRRCVYLAFFAPLDKSNFSCFIFFCTFVALVMNFQSELPFFDIFITLFFDTFSNMVLTLFLTFFLRVEVFNTSVLKKKSTLVCFRHFIVDKSIEMFWVSWHLVYRHFSIENKCRKKVSETTLFW